MSGEERDPPIGKSIWKRVARYCSHSMSRRISLATLMGSYALHLAHDHPERVGRMALHEPIAWGIFQNEGPEEMQEDFRGLCDRFFPEPPRAQRSGSENSSIIGTYLAPGTNFQRNEKRVGEVGFLRFITRSSTSVSTVYVGPLVGDPSTHLGDGIGIRHLRRSHGLQAIGGSYKIVSYDSDTWGPSRPDYSQRSGLAASR